jgi:hypothetical protein
MREISRQERDQLMTASKSGLDVCPIEETDQTSGDSEPSRRLS